MLATSPGSPARPMGGAHQNALALFRVVVDRGEDFGVDRAGADAVHPDPVIDQVQGHHLGQLVDPALGHHVGRDLRDRHDGIDRRHVDDSAALAVGAKRPA